MTTNMTTNMTTKINLNLLNKFMIVLVVLLIGLVNGQDQNQGQASEENIEEKDLLEDRYNFSIGTSFGVIGDHLGVGIHLTTPYFLKNFLAVDFYAGGFIVDSTVYHPKKFANSSGVYSSDYIDYQIFGNFKISFITAYNSDNFRAYVKAGPSLALIKDKTWEDYYNIIFQRAKVNDDGPDLIWGFHGVTGIELFFNYNRTVLSTFLEIGMEGFFNDHISPNISLSENISNIDIREIDFLIMIGTKYYF